MGLGDGNSEAPQSLLNRITRTERVYKFQVTKCEFYRVQSSRTERTSNRTGPQFDSNSVHSSRTELEQKSLEPNRGLVRLDLSTDIPCSTRSNRVEPSRNEPRSGR